MKRIFIGYLINYFYKLLHMDKPLELRENANLKIKFRFCFYKFLTLFLFNLINQIKLKQKIMAHHFPELILLCSVQH
jgi:hypothetical protein